MTDDRLGEVIAEFEIDGVRVRYVRHDEDRGVVAALCYLDQVSAEGRILRPPPSYAVVFRDGRIIREGKTIGHIREHGEG
jgi:hypothetical protein